MSDWKPCREALHIWDSEGIGKLRCTKCGAGGYERSSPNPITGRDSTSGRRAYKCKVCGGATISRNEACPTCREKADSHSTTPISELQKEVLFALLLDPWEKPLPQKWAAAVAALKRKGLIKRQIVQRTVWSITNKGKKALEK